MYETYVTIVRESKQIAISKTQCNKYVFKNLHLSKTCIIPHVTSYYFNKFFIIYVMLFNKYYQTKKIHLYSDV